MQIKGDNLKKVCFLIGNLNSSGGTERVTSLVANEISKRTDYQVSILSLVDGLQPFFLLNSNIRTYSLYEKKISFKKNLLGAIWRIRKFIKTHQIDTLIVVDSISCVFTVPALWGVKINHICWEHFNFKNNNNVTYRDLGRKWAAKYCDIVVTLTQRDTELWEKNLKYISAKILSIYNPCSFTKINVKPKQQNKVVLSIGHLTPVKGFDMLIEAWALVCQTNIDWKLKIVGEGSEEYALKELAKKLNIYNRIEFLPATKDIQAYYQTSSIYCLSSRNEGLPMVLLEAQAFGLPIVSFDCDTGPSDIVTHNVSGYLVESNNVIELARYLKQAINMSVKDYYSMSVSAIENNKNFKVELIVDKWISLI